MKLFPIGLLALGLTLANPVKSQTQPYLDRLQTQAANSQQAAADLNAQNVATFQKLQTDIGNAVRKSFEDSAQRQQDFNQWQANFSERQAQMQAAQENRQRSQAIQDKMNLLATTAFADITTAAETRKQRSAAWAKAADAMTLAVNYAESVGAEIHPENIATYVDVLSMANRLDDADAMLKRYFRTATAQDASYEKAQDLKVALTNMREAEGLFKALAEKVQSGQWSVTNNELRELRGLQLNPQQDESSYYYNAWDASEREDVLSAQSCINEFLDAAPKDHPLYADALKLRGPIQSKAQESSGAIAENLLKKTAAKIQENQWQDAHYLASQIPDGERNAEAWYYYTRFDVRGTNWDQASDDINRCFRSASQNDPFYSEAVELRDQIAREREKMHGKATMTIEAAANRMAELLQNNDLENARLEARNLLNIVANSPEKVTSQRAKDALDSLKKAVESPDAWKAMVETARSKECSNNLKQIGTALRVWANDNNDKFPFQLSKTEGGTMELRRIGSDGFDANSFQHFMVMAELVTPAMLVCPSDPVKKPAGSLHSVQAANLTYLLCTGEKVTSDDPDEVLARCPIHGCVLLCDGSVLTAEDWAKKQSK